MEKQFLTLDKIISAKPVKPNLEEFNLSDIDITSLEKFKSDTAIKSKRYQLILFFAIALFSGAIVHDFHLESWYLILTTTGSAILTWGILPFIIKVFFKMKLSELLFEKTKSPEMSIINNNYKSYELAMSDYKSKIYLFERAIGRATNNYWFSLSSKDFEDAVADLFADNGWHVYTTPASRDEGVDLFIEKDGVKAVVQCKTYKKVIGPNVARDLYGTMIANNASHAYLAAPGGFSSGTKSFCQGKPITLLDVDGLSKMFYPFEDYTPHWIDSAKSLDDIRTGINKHIYGGTRYGRRRY